MDIRQIIQSTIAIGKVKAGERNNSPSKAKTNSVRKWKECLASVNDYVGAERPLDCLEVVSTGWLDDFEHFLVTANTNKKGSGPLSASTAEGKRAQLKAYCREAVKRRIIPNIAVCPKSDGPVDAKEIEGLKPEPRKEDVESLLSLLNFKIERSGSSDLSASQKSALRSQAASIGYVALSVLLCGIGYDGLCRIKSADLCGNRLYLNHLDVTITLSDELVSILNWISSKEEGRRMLLFGDASAVSGEDLGRRASGVLSQLSLRFKDGFSEPMTQWLEIVLNLNGGALSAADARRIIDRLYRRNDEDRAGLDALIQATFDNVLKSMRHIRYGWYCIRCASSIREQSERVEDDLRLNSERSKGEILDALIRTKLKVNPVDVFAPKDRTVKDFDGKKVVRNDRFLDSLLFVKVNYMQLETINRYLMSIKGGFVYGDMSDGKLAYSLIPEREIYLLRGFFNERAGRRLDTSLPEAEKRFLGLNAKVIAGFYDGFEGRICRVIVDEKKHVRRLVIHIQGEYAKIEYNVDPEYIEIVS